MLSTNFDYNINFHFIIFVKHLIKDVFFQNIILREQKNRTFELFNFFDSSSNKK